MTSPKFSTIVLAGGLGTRMKSNLPKVLHPVAGDPMLQRVIVALRKAGAEEIRVVVGHGEALVRGVAEPLGVVCHKQEKQLGTADAVKAAEVDTLEGIVLICNGDHPLILAEDIQSLLETFRDRGLDLAVATAKVQRPGRLGRIVRSQGRMACIVEANEASPQTLAINEINTGIYVVRAKVLSEFLGEIKNANSKGEFYLTDLVSLVIAAGLKVDGLDVPKRVGFGVNDQRELALATRLVFRRKARALMDAGVIIVDPERVYVEENVVVGAGSVLYPDVYLRGKTRIGAFSVIEPNCIIIDTELAENGLIRAFSHLEGARLAESVVVGPYARLRPGSELSKGVIIGNFVELKNTKMGAHSKANHHTYLGDAEIGEDSNIGCGTITCNYAVDRKKYKTKIGRGVFVGSDSQFVAPVEVGDFAVIGSGSTITKNVPARALGLTRSKQMIREDYVKETIASDSQEGSNTPSAIHSTSGQK
jgi:bifunctional UDP-N-acetylglucosamine pyrophosphorylase/glucosamine-1-phosphate N-acetyltransferase